MTPRFIRSSGSIAILVLNMNLPYVLLWLIEYSKSQEIFEQRDDDGAGTAYLSGAPEFTPLFSGVRVIRS